MNLKTCLTFLFIVILVLMFYLLLFLLYQSDLDHLVVQAALCWPTECSLKITLKDEALEPNITFEGEK